MQSLCSLFIINLCSKLSTYKNFSISRVSHLIISLCFFVVFYTREIQGRNNLNQKTTNTQLTTTKRNNLSLSSIIIMISWTLTVLQLNNLRPKDIVTSSVSICKSQQFFNILLFWRVLSFALSLATCITNAVHQVRSHGQHWIFFLSLTNICFIFMAIYFLVCKIFKKRYILFYFSITQHFILLSILFMNLHFVDRVLHY